MSEWSQVRRLLVVFLGAREKVHVLLPAMRRLDGALPGAWLGWLGSPAAARDSSGLPAFDSVVPYPHRDPVDLDHPWSERSLVESVQADAYDGALIFTRPRESPWFAGYVCYLAGIPLRAGQSREFGGGVLSHAIQPPLDVEDRHLALLDALGIEMKNER